MKPNYAEAYLGLSGTIKAQGNDQLVEQIIGSHPMVHAAGER